MRCPVNAYKKDSFQVDQKSFRSQSSRKISWRFKPLVMTWLIRPLNPTSIQGSGDRGKQYPAFLNRSWVQSLPWCDITYALAHFSWTLRPRILWKRLLNQVWARGSGFTEKLGAFEQKPTFLRYLLANFAIRIMVIGKEREINKLNKN